MIPDQLFKSTYEYSKTLDYEVRVGYQAWAKPIARMMANSIILAMVFYPIVKSWSMEMSYRAGKAPKGHWFGKVVDFFGQPFSRLVFYIKGGYHGKVRSL
jgi:hypothetical protein